MAKITKYSKNQEWAFYDDNSIAHRHKLTPSQSIRCGDAKQCYYLVIDNKCLECGASPPAIN